MKFTDILALAKQGYTPADIKELLAIQTDNNDEAPDDQSATDTDKAEGPAQDEPENEPDDLASLESAQYKEEIEKLKAQTAALQSQLTQAQKDNLKKDLTKDTKSPEQILSDFFSH